jgi:hypothetical protein
MINAQLNIEKAFAYSKQTQQAINEREMTLTERFSSGGRGEHINARLTKAYQTNPKLKQFVRVHVFG